LLQLFIRDEELFTKTAVFVNSRHTAEKVYKSLQIRGKNTVAILNSASIEFLNFKTVNEFIENAEARVLIINDENIKSFELEDIPFLIHLELPEEKQTFISRVINDNTANASETLAITFATDLELPLIKKIEQAIGQKIPLGELPNDLVIEKERKSTEPIEKKTPKNKTAVPVAGEAFHQKKPENSKTYNYSSGVKAKMNKKKKYG
jgi:ATP-dependent RNA helicase RhlE